MYKFHSYAPWNSIFTPSIEPTRNVPFFLSFSSEHTHFQIWFPHTGFTCSRHALRYELYLSNLFWQNSPKHSLCVHLLVITQPETFIITQVNLRWSRVAVLHARTHDTKYDKLGTYKLHITTVHIMTCFLYTYTLLWSIWQRNVPPAPSRPPWLMTHSNWHKPNQEKYSSFTARRNHNKTNYDTKYEPKTSHIHHPSFTFTFNL